MADAEKAGTGALQAGGEKRAAGRRVSGGWVRRLVAFFVCVQEMFWVFSGGAGGEGEDLKKR